MIDQSQQLNTPILKKSFSPRLKHILLFIIGAFLSFILPEYLQGPGLFANDWFLWFFVGVPLLVLIISKIKKSRDETWISIRMVFLGFLIFYIIVTGIFIVSLALIVGSAWHAAG